MAITSTYGIDETAPPRLRHRLIKHLQKGRDPHQLPATLAPYFRLEGGFFSYSREPSHRLHRGTREPLAELLLSDSSPGLERLKRSCGEAVFESVEDFESRRECVEQMLRQLRIGDAQQVIALHVFRVLFSLHAKKQTGFSLFDNTDAFGLEPVEMLVQTANRDDSSTPLVLVCTSKGVYVRKPPESEAKIDPDPRLRYPVLFVRWENLQDKTLQKLSFLHYVTPSAPLPPYVVELCKTPQ